VLKISENSKTFLCDFSALKKDGLITRTTRSFGREKEVSKAALVSEGKTIIGAPTRTHY
jgi:hypothetical protein